MTLLTRYQNNEEIIEIGVDEVGRGPMFGRVYCAAVILPNDQSIFDHSLMKDSKKFTSEKKLIATADYIKKHCIAYSIGYMDESIIDNINIKNATHKAMHSAIKNLISFKNDNLLLIDGSNFLPITYLSENIIKQVPTVCIEGGDNKYSAIAAASIIAKVERDKYIYELCDKYPKLNELYDLRKNKGYGTKKHMDGIKEYGITQWHRKSFGICQRSVVNIIE